MAQNPDCKTHEEVMFYDTDAGGVVHNIAYLRFVEKARTLLGAKLGLSLKQMSKSGLYAVVTRTEVDYLKPALLGDELTVQGWLEDVGKVRFCCAFEIHRDSDGVRLVTSRQELAMVQMPEGRPSRLPEQFEKYRS